MWPFKISGNNNAKMCLRTNALNGKKIGEGFFLKYFILIFIHQTLILILTLVTPSTRLPVIHVRHIFVLIYFHTFILPVFGDTGDRDIGQECNALEMDTITLPGLLCHS